MRPPIVVQTSLIALKQRIALNAGSQRLCCVMKELVTHFKEPDDFSHFVQNQT
jgi:hypothetical protein